MACEELRRANRQAEKGHSAQEAGQLMHWFEFLVAFLTFGLCASAVYLVNDLLDLRSDRLHPTKRKRAMAAGRLACSSLVCGAIDFNMPPAPSGKAAHLPVLRSPPEMAVAVAVSGSAVSGGRTRSTL